MKKISALILALAMLLTGMTLVATAESTPVLSLETGSVYTTTPVFEVKAVITDVATFGGVKLVFNYGANIVPCNSDGSTTYTEWNNKIDATKIAKNEDDENVWQRMPVKMKDGQITYTLAAPTGGSLKYEVTAPYTIASFYFKPVASGDMGLTLDAATVYFTDDKAANIAISLDNTAKEVLDMPNAPSITAATVTGTLKSGEKATASYTWHNGNNKGTTTDGDASVINWTVGGKAVTKAETDGRLELTLTDDMVGKKLAYTVVPKADRDAALNNNVTEAVPSTESEIVMPADDYKPTAEVTIEKITAGKTPEVVVDIKALDALTTSADYKWYVVAEAADADAAIKAVKEADPAMEAIDTVLETEKLTKDYKDQYAVLEVIAKATIADKTYTAAEAVYAAAEIKVKKSGASAQTGASLVTGGNVTVKPEEPVKPEDPEVPTEPEKDPEDPQGAANDKGAAAFTDVDKEAYAWAYDSIDTLAKAGVIKGMTETTFGPELTTTNAQVIALAVRIAGLTAEEGATTDKVDAEHWVAGEMAIADANEILAVFGDKVDVEGETTREIAFTLLYNALKAAGVELAETAEAIEYSDAASISEGCVEAIEALTKAGIVNGMGDGTLAPKATLTRAQLAKILGLAEALIK